MQIRYGITDAEHQIILDNLGKISVPKIRERFLPRLSVSAIQSHIERRGLKSNRRLSGRYSYDINFFNEYTLQSCYWAGFIAADGALIYKGSQKTRTDTVSNITLSIKLSIKDQLHLETIKNAIKYTGPILFEDSKPSLLKDGRIIKGGKACKLAIALRSSTVQDLQTNFNIFENKTFTLSSPNILDLDLAAAFLKGFIDGDGCISFSKLKNTNRLTISLAGTYNMMEWSQKIINQIVNETCQNKIYKKGNIYRYNMCKYSIVVPLIHKLKSLNTDFLGRKWNKTDDYIKLCKPSNRKNRNVTI